MLILHADQGIQILHITLHTGLQMRRLLARIVMRALHCYIDFLYFEKECKFLKYFYINMLSISNMLSQLETAQMKQSLIEVWSFV